jgi:hypothetical protein
MAGRDRPMIKHLRLPLDIDLVRHPGQTVLRFSLHREALCDWCAGLSLLKEGLIEALTVSEQPGRGAKVRFLTEPKAGGTVRVSFRSDLSEITLTRNNLEYLQHFFLKYYRDGVAEVDHIDLQAVDTETGGTDIYVTFRVPESKAAVTPEEARRRLEG